MRLTRVYGECRAAWRFVGADSVRGLCVPGVVGAFLRMGFAGGVGVGGKSALSPALSLKGEGAVLSRRELQSYPDTPPPPRHSRERGNPVTARFASKLAPTKSKSALALGLPEKRPSAPERPFRRPSEAPAQEVMRHGCRESPAGYRDVPSGRASVAGEFVRVARLHRARMRGKPFWFLLWRLTKGTRPRGRNKKSPQTRCGAVHPNKKAAGFPRSRE
ncbi:hypothetical protein J2T41_001315 [Pseudomonas citronellolis]|nr:hypothetical protein [Pseudomonas citronellolis]MCP1664634.1 hypothetical protein [Pseudomonas citronellolis]MCP1695907.1 hypothetical protein [Pseudomonas citronellolis]MCP1702470.1 hypothetical protein [Pseudomonas citronellolis]MCP1796355.1 hypothetical protein [Pseudomonas citronellolis]